MLYIAGLGRSGSTILGNVLGEIEGFFHGGELNFIWEHNLIGNRLCGCGAPFDKCEVWASVLAFGGVDRGDAHEMVRLQSLGARTRHVPLMFFPQGRWILASRLREYMVRLEKLYLAVREVTGSRVIVDSSKLPSYGFMLGMTPNIDLHVVHLIRDPRAAAHSYLKEPRPDADERNYLPRVNIVKSSLLWDVWNASSEALWRGSSGRYMRLRYEDFVDKPRRTIEDILSMLHEDDTCRLPFVGERDVELGVSHTVSGNPNRFRTGPVQLRPDEEWSYRMGSREKMLVALLTLPLLARYGYPISTRDTLEG